MIVNSLPQEITVIIDIIQDIGCNLEQRTSVKFDKLGVLWKWSSSFEGRFVWERKPLSRCSVSCQGRKIIQYICTQKTKTKQQKLVLQPRI